MTKKEKSWMTSNQKKNKSEMNWSMKKMKNVRLYLIIIILKQTKNRKSKEDM